MHVLDVHEGDLEILARYGNDKDLQNLFLTRSGRFHSPEYNKRLDDHALLLVKMNFEYIYNKNYIFALEIETSINNNDPQPSRLELKETVIDYTIENTEEDLSRIVLRPGTLDEWKTIVKQSIAENKAIRANDKAIEANRNLTVKHINWEDRKILGNRMVDRVEILYR